ncbi:MBL fold metallo-hydrolase [Sutcliffiella cohnii]
MYKHHLLALFTVVLFIFTGCAQESTNLGNNTSVHNQEQNSIDKEPPSIKEEIEVEKNANEKESQSLSELKVHYMNVGQADSTLLQFTVEGEAFHILIDAGNWNRNDVVNYLHAQNVSHIDIAIGTHPDADHIGQLDKVINTFDVGEVWMSGNTNSSQTFQRVLEAIDKSGADYYEPRMGDEFEIGSLEIAVLYPKTITENDNEESISLKITYGDIRFIFTGDASKKNELNMMQSGFDLDADILQLGHHGSSTSTDPAFLSTVNPSIAIYSAGVDNSYGHPHDEVVNLVQNAGIDLYGTDVHGTIIVSTDGKDYKVFTNKDGTITPSSKKGTPSGNKKTEEPKQDSNITKGCIDVNSASIDQLQGIKHIGIERAEQLVNIRPFKTIDDLSRITGIGPARIKDIKEQGLACVGG